MTHLLNEVTIVVVFFAALYIAGASLCRLRMADISRSWVLLYTALFGNAVWCAHEIIYSSLQARDICTILLVAWYIHLTRRRWRSGVPKVARSVQKNKLVEG
jgi:hypothetical protein